MNSVQQAHFFFNIKPSRIMSKAILEQELEPIAAQLPELPPSVKEGFVKYVPIVTLVLLILTLPALLALLALGGALFAFAGLAGIQSLLALVIGIASVVFTIIALPGLFKRTRAGWVNEYYAQLLSILASVISIQILSVVFSLIWLYVLFKVRDAYQA
jgi:hypothetical protein